MRWSFILIAGLLAVLAACGGNEGEGEAPDSGVGDGSTAGENAGGSDDGGELVADPAPPGQAIASIDGQTVTYDTIDPEGCEITGSEIFFSLSSSDNPEMELITGSAFLMDDGWSGGFLVFMEGPDGQVSYDPLGDLEAGGGGTVAVEANSFTYSGEWETLRGTDYESVGPGTLSVNCG